MANPRLGGCTDDVGVEAEEEGEKGAGLGEFPTSDHSGRRSWIGFNVSRRL